MDIDLKWYARKLTPVLQAEAAECGLACLVMVANFYGKNTNLTTLRSRNSISLKGMTLNALVHTALDCDLDGRPVKVELDSLGSLKLPAILHWDFNHFVVLTKVKGKKVIIVDPEKGERTLNFQQLSNHFTGVALELDPAVTFKREEEKKTLKLRSLFSGLNNLSGTFGQILILAFSLQVFSLASPFFMQLVVDTAIVSADVNLLATLGVGFLLLTLVQVLVTAARSWVVMILGNTIDYHFQKNLFRHLLLLPLSFFEKRHMGDIISRFDSLGHIQDAFSRQLIETLVDGVLVFTTLIMMFLYSSVLSCIVLIAALLYGVFRVVLYRPLKLASEEQIVYGAKKQSHFLESVKAVQSIKVYSNETQRQSQFNNLMVDSYNAGIKVQKLNILYRFFNGVTFGIENILVIWLGGVSVIGGDLSVGMLFAFIAYKRNFIGSVTGLTDRLIEFKMLSLHLQRIADIALQPIDTLGGDPIPCKPSVISLYNVGFRFSPTEPFLFKGLNIDIKPGSTLAIVAPSGQGKSTLLKLILGLILPTEGDVKYGDIPLSRINKKQYRGRICAVTQDDQLIAGSIRDNILFGCLTSLQDKMEDAAKLAAIHEEIQGMPMGYNTLIGDMGAVLSSGQKQRVLLARALYRNPEVLIMDEATSHLDLVNEKRIIQGIKKLNITQIIVAHRPHTIASADRIMRLTGQGLVELQSDLNNSRGDTSQAQLV